MRFDTCRGEIVEDVGELEGTVTGVQIWDDVVMVDVLERFRLMFSGWISFHHLWSCLSR